MFADAAGVVRTGNTAVFRIGSDALGTARAIIEHALAPALAGVRAADRYRRPRRVGGALRRLGTVRRRRLALAVARGSGPAVAQLGAVARQAGVAVSLHGTGGAWIVAGRPPTPIASTRRSSTRSTARCATRSTSVASRGSGRRAGSRRDRRAARGGDRPGHRRPAPRRSGVRAVRRGGGVHASWSSAPTATTTSRSRRRSASTVEHRMGVGALARDVPGRGRRRRHRGRALQPLQPALHGLARSAPTRLSTTASTPPSTRRSSVTGSPDGSTGSTHSTHPSSACRTGSTAGSSHAGRSCPVTRCTRCATGRRSTTHDPPVRAGIPRSDQDHTPLMSTMR